MTQQLPRRNFLTGSTLSALTAAYANHPGLLANQTASSARDGKGWIDAHVHVWSPDVQRYPLDPAFKVADMQPPSFTDEELLHHCRPHGVERIVLIQMSFYGMNHDYMFDVMQRNPGVFSAVALIEHRSEKVVQQAKELVKRGAKGFRIHSQGDAASWPQSVTMRRLWQVASDEGFAICPLINPNDLQHVAKLCELFPKTRVVIDHFARIGISGTIESDKLDELCRLAEYENVYVKVSAFYALGKKQDPYLDLQSMIQRLLTAYSSNRLMWATDCPYQVQGQHTYRASLDLILHHCEFLSPEDKQWILRDTAEKIFFA